MAPILVRCRVYGIIALASSTQRYNFSEFSTPISLTVKDVQTFLLSTNAPEHAATFQEIDKLRTALQTRMRQINVRSPAIDGKSTNPFVLTAYAELFNIQDLKKVDDIVAAAKVFSSIETAAGRVVEDVIPPFFGWEQVDSPGHTLLSEIDCARVVGDAVELVALKSGPMCINDSMVSQIANAVSSHWRDWAAHWNVSSVRYIVGMNYSTAKNSNKKDWHIVRLVEESVSSNGGKILNSCMRLDGNRPMASSFFEAQQNDKLLRVETLQGSELWAHIAETQDAFLKICWAMAKCLNTVSVPADSNFTIGEMREIMQFSEQLNTPDISDGEKQWLVLLARHFVDELCMH